MTARAPDHPDRTINLGVLRSTSQLWHGAWLLTYLGQYHGHVQGQLMQAAHLFRGVKRPFALGDDMNADRHVLVYSWVPGCDWVCHGSAAGVFPVATNAPSGRVFTVLANQYADVDEHGVSGSIEDFCWVREDPRLAGAPISYDTRYVEGLWSRT